MSARNAISKTIPLNIESTWHTSLHDLNNICYDVDIDVNHTDYNIVVATDEATSMSWAAGVGAFTFGFRWDAATISWWYAWRNIVIIYKHLFYYFIIINVTIIIKTITITTSPSSLSLETGRLHHLNFHCYLIAFWFRTIAQWWWWWSTCNFLRSDVFKLVAQSFWWLKTLNKTQPLWGPCARPRTLNNGHGRSRSQFKLRYVLNTF